MKKVFKFLLAFSLAFSLTACKQEEKVKVGITWAMEAEDAKEDEDIQAYVEAIKKSGGEPVLMKQATDKESALKAIEEVDCIVLAGGEDINPSLYNEEPHEKLEDVNDERDLSDSLIIEAAIEKDMPLLGTCRGMQILNVVCGGTLYQDLPSEYEIDIIHRDPELYDFTYHDITVEDGNILADAMKDGAGVYNVNSWHHQGIKDLGNDLKVVAMSDDGMIEGIVYTKATYIYAVQFHPEWHIVEETLDCTSMFKALMEASK